MSWLEALIIGILQALTEFLPVSSSGHIELAKVVQDIENADDASFSVVVHVATALSTVVVFRKDIWKLIQSLFVGDDWDSRRFVLFIILSMIPVGIVGVFFKDEVEQLFTGNLILVGSMLLVTAILLMITRFVEHGHRQLNWWIAIVVGVAQAVAVLPGISRSGATIATALILGVPREQAARFSFLMVIAPILGAGVLEAKDLASGEAEMLGITPLIVGFLASFIFGVLACQLMLRLVKKGNLHWFAFYVLAVGLTALTVGLITG